VLQSNSHGEAQSGGDGEAQPGKAGELWSARTR